MKNVLAIAAVAEAATGLALLAVPSLVGQLLLGRELTGVTIVVGRLASIALIGLGVACWPGADTRQASYGMVTYSGLAMLYLIYIGVRGESVGPLLWPGVVVHAVIAILLGLTLLSAR